MHIDARRVELQIALPGGKTMKNNFGGHQELPYRYFVYLPAIQAV
jgi:hypothetical protein